MKTIITLLFSFAFATTFAQYNHGENNRTDQYATNSRGYGRMQRGNFYDRRAISFQIEKINRDFDYKIRAIETDPYMRRREKRIAIRSAEYQRARQIKMVSQRGEFLRKDRGDFDRHDNDHDRR